MPTDLPFSIVIQQVIAHTPPWVWGILALITYLGLKQVVDHVVTLRRLAIAPVALGALSLSGVTNAFGLHAEVLALWAVGVALAVAANHWLAWPRKVQYESAGRYAVQGSLWPLIGMWSMFAVRYVTTVTLVLHRDWAHGTVFGMVMPLVFGALSGMFLARSLRILRTAPSSSALSLA
jgi:hypothetical protein